MAGNLDEKFDKKTKAVRDFATTLAQGLRNIGQVTWDTLADGDPEVEAGPERFLESFREEFDRSALKDKYIEVYSQRNTSSQDVKGTLGELRLYRHQYDWLMQAERDYLMRRKSRVRTEAHAAAIAEMIGDDKGPIEVGVKRLAKNLLALSEEKP